jgi:hypothetical protein
MNHNVTKIFLLLVLVGVCSCASSPKYNLEDSFDPFTLNKVDQNGLRQGFWEDTIKLKMLENSVYREISLVTLKAHKNGVELLNYSELEKIWSKKKNHISIQRSKIDSNYFNGVIRATQKSSISNKIDFTFEDGVLTSIKYNKNRTSIFINYVYQSTKLGTHRIDYYLDELGNITSTVITKIFDKNHWKVINVDYH